MSSMNVSTNNKCAFCKSIVLDGLFLNGNVFCTNDCHSAFNIYQSETHAVVPHGRVEKVTHGRVEKVSHGGGEKVTHGGGEKVTFTCAYCKYLMKCDSNTLVFEGKVYCREKCRALANQNWTLPPPINFGGFAESGAPVLMGPMNPIFPLYRK